MARPSTPKSEEIARRREERKAQNKVDAETLSEGRTEPSQILQVKMEKAAALKEVRAQNSEELQELREFADKLIRGRDEFAGTYEQILWVLEELPRKERTKAEEDAEDENGADETTEAVTPDGPTTTVIPAGGE